MLIDKRILEKYADEEAHPVSIQDIADRLQYHEFFSLFPANVRAELLKKAVHKSYKAGEVIYYRGDTHAYMGVVMSGRLRMSMNAPDGRGVLIGLVESGEVFGETALIDGLPRTTDAHAEANTTLMLIRHEDFVPALKANPEAMFGVVNMLCHRLRIYLDTIEIIALQNLPARLARMLLRLAGEYGTEENGNIVIRAKLNQTSIGQKLATSREGINRQLKDFATRGFIRIEGDEITLLDAEGLHRTAG